MRKMWSFLLAALALTGCAAAPADALPAAETAEMTTTETEETAAPPVGFTVGNLSEVPNTCGGYWGWNTGDAYYEIARLDDENDSESMTTPPPGRPCCATYPAAPMTMPPVPPGWRIGHAPTCW